MKQEKPLKKFYNLPEIAPAGEIFFIPAIDNGLKFFDNQLPDWKKWPKTQLRLINGVTPGKKYAVKLHYLLLKYACQGTSENTYELYTVPAVVRNISTSNLNYSIEGKLCLFGKIGEAVRKSYWKKNKAQTQKLDKEFNEHFSKLNQKKSPATQIISKKELIPRDYVIVCRNLYNYYHFVVETLSQLCLVEDIPNFNGKIYLVHFENKVATFVIKFIEALFPELVDKLVIVSQDFERSEAIIPYQSTYNVLYQRKGKFEEFPEFQTAANIWDKKTYLSGIQRRDLLLNSFESSLLRLRERALAKISSQPMVDTPKRVWIKRSDKLASLRELENEDILFEKLRPLGFEQVVFENLSPEEQIATFHNAEFVLGQHGAGFTNMLFANSDAHVFEIGNFLSVRNRLSDWVQIANASQCKYVIIAADIDDFFLYDVEDNIGGVLPISISEVMIDRIIGMIKIISDVDFWPSSNELGVLFSDLAQAKLWDQIAKLMTRFEHMIGDDPRILFACIDYHLATKNYEAAQTYLDIVSSIGNRSEGYFERYVLLCDLTGNNSLKSFVLAEAKIKHPNLDYWYDLITGNFPGGKYEVS